MPHHEKAGMVSHPGVPILLFHCNFFFRAYIEFVILIVDCDDSAFEFLAGKQGFTEPIFDMTLDGACEWTRTIFRVISFLGNLFGGRLGDFEMDILDRSNALSAD